MILPYHTVSLGPQTYNDIPKYSVIHIQAAFPDHLPGVNSQFISLLYMIVKQCSQQIIR